MAKGLYAQLLIPLQKAHPKPTRDILNRHATGGGLHVELKCHVLICHLSFTLIRSQPFKGREDNSQLPVDNAINVQHSS
jgi:hypothetical protein